MSQFDFNRKALKQILKEKKITYTKLAEMMTNAGVFIAEPTIKSWFVSKGNSTPDILKINKIAEVLEVDINDLVEQSVFDTRLPLKPVPIIADASCGLPISNCYQDDEMVYVIADEWNPDLYAVIACGDSMFPEISDGDRLVCDPTQHIITGDLVHYTLFNDSAIKVYLKDETTNIVQFKPINNSPNFMTVTILPGDTDMVDDLKISKVVKISREVSNSRKARLRLLGIKQ